MKIEIVKTCVISPPYTMDRISKFLVNSAVGRFLFIIEVVKKHDKIFYEFMCRPHCKRVQCSPYPLFSLAFTFHILHDPHGNVNKITGAMA